jgi:hypothetical protein
VGYLLLLKADFNVCANSLQVLDLFRKPIYHVRLLETLNNLFPQPLVYLVKG